MCEGVSSVSGRWRVEECGGEGEGGGGGESEGRIRRLVFAETSTLVQTEMRLIPGTVHFNLDINYCARLKCL